jgi:DNA adenine methylase
MNINKHKSYSKLLAKTKIHNKDFKDIMTEYDDENTFIFLDPPYDSVFNDYGYCVFDKEKQKELAECFKKSKSKCLMVIGASELIRELYDGYIVDEYDKKYRFRLHSNRIGNEIDNKHLVIKNY